MWCLGAGYSWSNVIHTFAGGDRKRWWCGGGGAQSSLMTTSLGGRDWLLCWCLYLIFSIFLCNDFLRVSLILHASLILIVVVAVVAEQLSPSGHVAMSGLIEYYPFVHHEHEHEHDHDDYGVLLLLLHALLQQELYHEWCLLYVSAGGSSQDGWITFLSQ